jgi:hypothetical protein
VVEKAITLRFVYSKRAKRSLYALCSLCTFVVEKAITLRFVYSKKSEAITLRFVFFVHFCGGKSDHSTLCVLCALCGGKSGRYAVMENIVREKSRPDNILIFDKCSLGDH